MDKAGADFEGNLKSIQEKLSPQALPLQLPVGLEDKLEGVIDLLKMKMIKFEGENGEIVKELDLLRLNDVLTLFEVKRLNDVLVFVTKRCPEPCHLFSCTNNGLASAIQVSDRRFLNLAALTHGLVSELQIYLSADR